MPDGNPSHDRELLTIAEAADLLRAPVATLRYWRHLGTGLRSFRLGRRVPAATTFTPGSITSALNRRPATADQRVEPAAQQGVGMGGSTRRCAEAGCERVVG